MYLRCTLKLLEIQIEGAQDTQIYLQVWTQGRKSQPMSATVGSVAFEVAEKYIECSTRLGSI